MQVVQWLSRFVVMALLATVGTGHSATSGDTILEAIIEAANTDNDDHFGRSIALEGSTLVIGAPGEDSADNLINGDGSNNDGTDIGAAYVFVRTGTNWVQQAYLKAADNDQRDGLGNLINENAAFGMVVRMSGDTVAVGSSQGTYVFTRTGSNWVQQAKISVPAELFAPFDLSQDTLVFPQQDAVDVHVRQGSTWTMQAQIPVPGFSRFRNVRIDGDTITASSDPPPPAAGTFGLDGAIRVFERVGTTWTESALLTTEEILEPRLSTFMKGASIDGDTIIAQTDVDILFGHSGHSDGYIYRRSTNGWELQDIVKPDQRRGVVSY